MKKFKKLTLNKETISQLSSKEMEGIVGASTNHCSIVETDCTYSECGTCVPGSGVGTCDCADPAETHNADLTCDGDVCTGTGTGVANSCGIATCGYGLECDQSNFYKCTVNWNDPQQPANTFCC